MRWIKRKIDDFVDPVDIEELTDENGNVKDRIVGQTRQTAVDIGEDTTFYIIETNEEKKEETWTEEKKEDHRKKINRNPRYEFIVENGKLKKKKIKKTKIQKPIIMKTDLFKPNNKPKLVSIDLNDNSSNNLEL